MNRHNRRFIALFSAIFVLFDLFLPPVLQTQDHAVDWHSWLQENWPTTAACLANIEISPLGILTFTRLVPSSNAESKRQPSSPQWEVLLQTENGSKNASACFASAQHINTAQRESRFELQFDAKTSRWMLGAENRAANHRSLGLAAVLEKLKPSQSDVRSFEHVAQNRKRLRPSKHPRSLPPSLQASVEDTAFSHVAKLEQCYQHNIFLSRGDSLRIQLRFTVELSGRVQQAHARLIDQGDSSDVSDPPDPLAFKKNLLQCLGESMKNWKFQPRLSSIEIVYPLSVHVEP